MTLIDKLSRRLLAPPAKGRRALLYAIILVAVPTLIRWSLIGHVTGSGFLVYYPFVLLGAMVLDTRHALGLALISAFIGDLLFVGPPMQFLESLTDIFGVGLFLASSIIGIALVEAVRTIVENSLRPARPDSAFSAPVIFSLEDGQAWVSWHGSHSWVRLGEEEQVAEMMQDFLSKRQLAKRLEQAAK